MSKSLKSRVLLSAVVGLAAGALVMHFFKQETVIGRAPASVSRSQTFAQPRLSGKALSVLQVALQAPQGIPADEREDAVLVGWIRLNQELEEPLHFKWEIPNDVQVVDGDRSGSWSGVRKGQTFEVRLRVRGFSQEMLKMIALHGFIQAGPTEFGNSALLTSRPEDSYELITGEAAPAEVGSQKVRAASPSGNNRPLLRGKIFR